MNFKKYLEAGGIDYLTSLGQVPQETRQKYGMRASKEYFLPQNTVPSPWEWEEKEKIIKDIRYGKIPSQRVKVNPSEVKFTQDEGISGAKIRDMINQGAPSGAMHPVGQPLMPVAVRYQGVIYVLEGHHRGVWHAAYDESFEVLLADI